jgi:hypothetical protein
MENVKSSTNVTELGIFFFMIRGVVSRAVSRISRFAPFAKADVSGPWLKFGSSNLPERAVSHPFSGSVRFYSGLISPKTMTSMTKSPTSGVFLSNLIGIRSVSTKQRKRWKIRKYHFKLRLKSTMRKMRVPYVSSKARGQAKKKPILYDFRPLLRRKLKRAER